MIIDTSVLLALIQEEEDAPRYLDAMIGADRRRISAGTLLEANIVVERLQDPGMARRLQRLVDRFELEVVPFDRKQFEIGRQAYRDFGRGLGNRAQLNFGDCFGYALATATGEPLLFKGNDFSHTDVRLALP